MQRQQVSHRPRFYSASYNKGAAVGNTAGTVPPAWRTNVAQDRFAYRGHREGAYVQNGVTQYRRQDFRMPQFGSKILISQLPADSVSERDIEELFTETIGPIFNVFIIHNSQGRSKGMAVVNFQRSEDAGRARKEYNGKIIDGRRPLKIELITDPPEEPVKQRTLAERLGGPLINGDAEHSTRVLRKPGVAASVPAARVRPQTQRRHLKKGPRRLKKSMEQLDREMEVYMADAPRITGPDIAAAVNNVGNRMQA